MMTKPRLFGTSGIRGIFSAETDLDAVVAFTLHNLLTPKLIRRIAQALARVYFESGNQLPVEIWRDVRPSGTDLLRSIIGVFAGQSVPYLYRGVVPTTFYSCRNDCWVIVITASHNPVEWNGIKVFREGRPLERFWEARIESLTGDPLPDTGPDITGVSTEPDRKIFVETQSLQLRYLEEHAPVNQLRKKLNSLKQSLFIPLDLAYGSSACPVDSRGKITVLSPQVSVLLKLGVPIVGYGYCQDGDKTNFRIGAAYAYGETPEKPEPAEMIAFANGRLGYGTPAERIVLYPSCAASIPVSGCAEAVPEHVAYLCRTGIPDATESAWILHPDHPAMPVECKTAIEHDLENRNALPGLMVDCDADRILVTTPLVAQSGIPYVSGDVIIRLFAETAPPGTYSEIAFTIESGLALDVSLQKQREQDRRSGYPPFDIRAVTVGDRAIIDLFIDAGPGRRLGGEPSGHVIFCEKTVQSWKLIDDPFITYLLLLDRISRFGFDLDALLHASLERVPEVFCARKPDSLAGTGLTVTEKTALELWNTVLPGTLSRYATAFIPEYIRLYTAMLGDVFDWGCPADAVMTGGWRQLVENGMDVPSDGLELSVGRTGFPGGVVVDAVLHLDLRTWAGPDVIRIGFYCILPDASPHRLGEGVFRNSGTSPKNAGYHKLWMENPVTQTNVDPQKLKDALTKLAVQRALFTDGYVRKVLRG